MISVCMAAYNGETYIKEQLSSILNQLTNEDEVIISDDGSTDSTINIIKSFNDERVKILHNKQTKEGKSKHQIVTANFENSLKNAKGDYIFLADQDDVWRNDKVKVCLKYLINYDILLTNSEIIDYNGKSLNENLFKKNPLQSNFFSNLYKMPFYGCCLCFKKSVLDLALPFPKKLLLHDNWIAFVALSRNKNKIKYIDQPLVYYRRHLQNVSGVSKNNIFFKISYRFTFLLEVIKRINEK